jgi:hypothetical protein
MPLSLLTGALAAAAALSPQQQPPAPPPPPPPGAGMRMGGGGGAMLRRADADGDGRVTRDEYRAAADRMFAAVDANADGVIDANEMAAMPRPMRRGERGPVPPPPPPAGE